MSCPVVKINYRLDDNNKYPTLVHDILTGYDWVLENLLPKRAITRAGRSESVGKVAVCGEHIGGGLATALALTECRVGEPGVVAAALNNPLVDWVSLDDGAHDKVLKPGRKVLPSDVHTSIQDFQTLRSLRAQLFARPDRYFDPFASPLLFFRSPGVEVPPAPEAVPVDDLDHLSKLERANFYRRELAAGTDLEEPSPNQSVAGEDIAITKRKASRQFPSKALGLRLPYFHISAGLSSPLKGQASELAHLLRRSFVRQSKHATSASTSFGRKVLQEDEEDDLDDDERAALDLQFAEASNRAELKMNDGFGSWDDTAAGKARVLEVARWLKDRLG